MNDVTEWKRYNVCVCIFFELNVIPNNYAYSISPMMQNQYKHKHVTEWNLFGPTQIFYQQDKTHLT